MNTQNQLSVSRLNEIFDVDFEAGFLTYRPRPRAQFATERGYMQWNNRNAGRRIGQGQPEGAYARVSVTFESVRYAMTVHTVIWAMATGKWSLMTIDHRDRCRSNNCLKNLREATYQDQCANKSVGRAGLKGASWARSKWQAHIKRDGVNHYLGRFDTEEAAHFAYMSAANRLHGEFATDGKTQ